MQLDSKKGTENAANHINCVIIVNTPHLGSKLVSKNIEKVEKDFPGMAAIMRDIDNSGDYTLVNAKINTNALVKLKILASAIFALSLCALAAEN